MCRYCEPNDRGLYRPFAERNIGFHIPLLGIEKCENTGRPLLTVHFDGDEPLQVMISFCPFCGKKLVGQSNPEGIHSAFEKRNNKKSQTVAIREYLLQGHSITPMDALELFGCFRLGARIADLKKMGMNIKSEIRKDESTGKRYSRYWLVG